MPEALDEKSILTALKSLPPWSFSENKISRNYEFKDHLEAMAFLNAVAFYAEKVAHHPEVFLCYNKVTLAYQTHDAGAKVTVKDIDAAHHMEELLKK